MSPLAAARPMFLAAFLLASTHGHAKNSADMRARVQQVKASIVRILVNGLPSGTGFAVKSNLVATNFHVVQQATATTDGNTQIGYAAKIEVLLPDGRRLSATPHASVLNAGFQAALSKDVALLVVPVNDLKPLKLGRFADASEGDSIYLAGYPLAVEQPVVATGILSTKWKTGGYLGQGGPRDVAWLDVTMNKGNSGGPVLLMADNPVDDVVVGIANFNLNPFAQRAEEFGRIAAGFPGSVVMMGINFGQFASIVSAAMSAQSHGVGGCIAVDYLGVPK